MIPTLLKCSVLIDSDGYRGIIEDLIKSHPNLEIQQSFKKPEEAISYIVENPNELLFLKVEMNEGSGFTFLDGLSIKPNVIFIADDTKSAFKAFEYAAIDYLTLPLKKDRFLYAVEKALLNNKLASEKEPESGEFIFVKSNLKEIKVYLQSLKYVQALGDYVKLITDKDTYIVLSTMKSFEKTLPEESFKRIHKSYIVNLDRISRYNSKAVELDNEVLPLSRFRKPKLIEALKHKGQFD